MNVPTPSRALPWPVAVLLAMVALAIFLPGFSSLPVVDRDEARFAQASRQMLDSGDLVDIRFHDQARHKKPVGIYWLQSAAVGLVEATGLATRADAIWPYRLPSLIAAVASVVLVAAIGVLLFDLAAGITAGLLMAASLVLNFEARVATTDATLLACTLAFQAMLAAAWVRARDIGAHLGWGTLALGWAGLGLGMLVKGPIILLVAGGTIGGLAVLGHGFGWLRSMRPILGGTLALVIVLPWLVGITLKTDGAFFRESVGQDLLGKLFHAETAIRAPPGLHTLMFWIRFWPGSLIVMLALPWIWRERGRREVRFLLAWAIPTWVVFELPLTKLIHYVLPAYPALALLGAAWLTRGAPIVWGERMRRAIVTVWVTLTLSLSAAVALLPYAIEGRIAPVGLTFALVTLVGLLAVPKLREDRPWLVVGALGLSALALMLAVAATVPGIRALFLSYRIVETLPRLPGCPSPSLVSAGYEEPSLVLLTSPSIRFLTGPQAAEALALASAPCVVAVVEKRQQGWFDEKAVALRIVPVEVGRVEGTSYANSRRMNFRIYTLARR